MIVIISLDTLIDNGLFENEDNFPFAIELLSFRRSNLFGSVRTRRNGERERESVSLR